MDGNQVFDMEQEEAKKGKEPKKTYRKPEVKQIELRAEEAVLGACKSGASAGPGSGTCTVPTACSTVGS